MSVAKKLRYWLIKSEGETYPIQQLKQDGTTPWSGVRNFRARNYMRDDMKKGDMCLFYHSNVEHIGVYGIAKIVSEPYPDPTQFDTESPYFEPRSSREKPTWILVDVAFDSEFKHFVSRGAMQAEESLSDMMLWKASRLSIIPVTEKHFRRIVKMSTE